MDEKTDVKSLTSKFSAEISDGDVKNFKVFFFSILATLVQRNFLKLGTLSLWLPQKTIHFVFTY